MMALITTIFPRMEDSSSGMRILRPPWAEIFYTLRIHILLDYNRLWFGYTRNWHVTKNFLLRSKSFLILRGRPCFQIPKFGVTT